MSLRVVVDRSRWLRGEGGFSSYLLRKSDGKMCCLGFACLAAGHSVETIKGMGTPSMVPECKLQGIVPNDSPSEGAPPMMYDEGTGPVYASLMSANDKHNVVDREAVIAKLGMKIGLEFEFVDGTETS